jgi:hypothetical protein
MNLRRLVALLVVLCSAAAGAAPVTGSLPVPARIVDSVVTWSESEILSQFGPLKPGLSTIENGAIARTLPVAGRFVKFGGPVVIGASLTLAALNWYYDEVKREAGGPLGDWWANKGAPDSLPAQVQSPDWNTQQPVTLSKVAECQSNYYPRAAYYLSSTNYATRYLGFNGETLVGGRGPAGPGSGAQTIDEWKAGACKAGTGAKPLSDVLNANPTAYPKVRDVVGQYLTAHPEAARPLLQPAPNDNQWTDNPYTNPTLDTDGDGVPDPVEFESPDGDLNDPAKKPQGAPYEVSRSTSVTRNPDGSTTQTTTVKYSDGTSSSSSTNTKVTTTKNPDGSTTQRTTTTVTTVAKDGTTTTRTTFNDVTRPGNAPAPLPLGSPGPYKGPSPSADDDADGIPNERDRSPYGPGGTPSSPVPSSPVDPSNAPVPGDPDFIPNPSNPDPTADPANTPAKDPMKDPAYCAVAGGVMVGGTCSPDPKKDPDKDPTACSLKGGVIQDGRCAPDPKKDPDKDPGKCALLGGVIKDGKCGPDPDKDKKDCEKVTGQVFDPATSKCGKKDDPPVPDDCGVFTISRLIQHTGSYLKDVVFPCKDLDWGDVGRALQNKFPFSLITQMNSITAVGEATSSENSLPTSIGPFSLDFSFANPFFAFIKIAFRAVLWFMFFRWLLGRLSGQVIIS